MRLRQDKIHDLAGQIVALLRDHPQVSVLAGEDALRVAIGSVILDDLKEEEDIDREADALLAANAKQIAQGDLDTHALRMKFRQEIARQRGFIL